MTSTWRALHRCLASATSWPGENVTFNVGQEMARASIHLPKQFSKDRNVCVFANYRTNPLSRAYRLSFCNWAASPQPAVFLVSCVAGFALNRLRSYRNQMRTTKMQSVISGIFSDPSTTIAFRASFSDCRQAQVGRCSKTIIKSIPFVVIWTTRHVDPRQGLLQVGEELLLCHLHLPSWAEFVTSTVRYVITWNPTPSHSSAAEAAAWAIAVCEETQPKTTRNLITWRRLRWKSGFMGMEEPSHLLWCFQELYWHLLAVGLQCESWLRRPASPQCVSMFIPRLQRCTMQPSTSIKLPNSIGEMRPRTFTVVTCKAHPAVPCKHVKM